MECICSLLELRYQGADFACTSAVLITSTVLYPALALAGRMPSLSETSMSCCGGKKIVHYERRQNFCPARRNPQLFMANL